MLLLIAQVFRRIKVTIMKKLLTTACLFVVTIVAPVSFNVSTVLGQQNFSQTKAIRFGKLVDGSGKVLTNAIVVVEGDRIKSVSTATTPACIRR